MVTHACRVFAFPGRIFTGVASCLSHLMPHRDPCLQGPELPPGGVQLAMQVSLLWCAAVGIVPEQLVLIHLICAARFIPAI